MYRPKLRLFDVPPVGSREVTGFVCTADGTGIARVDLPVYPAHPKGEALAATRKALGLGLRDAADRLGLRPSQVSGLEHGSLRVVDWDEAFARLRGA